MKNSIKKAISILLFSTIILTSCFISGAVFAQDTQEYTVTTAMGSATDTLNTAENLLYGKESTTYPGVHFAQLTDGINKEVAVGSASSAWPLKFTYKLGGIYKIDKVAVTSTTGNYRLGEYAIYVSDSDSDLYNEENLIATVTNGQVFDYYSNKTTVDTIEFSESCDTKGSYFGLKLIDPSANTALEAARIWEIEVNGSEAVDDFTVTSAEESESVANADNLIKGKTTIEYPTQFSGFTDSNANTTVTVGKQENAPYYFTFELDDYATVEAVRIISYTDWNKQLHLGNFEVYISDSYDITDKNTTLYAEENKIATVTNSTADNKNYNMVNLIEFSKSAQKSGKYVGFKVNQLTVIGDNSGARIREIEVLGTKCDTVTVITGDGGTANFEGTAVIADNTKGITVNITPDNGNIISEIKQNGVVTDRATSFTYTEGTNTLEVSFAAAGDTNGNQYIDDNDLSTVKKYILGTVEKDIRISTDINYDNKINILDLVQASELKEDKNYGMPAPDYFNNTYTKLTVDKELTIGFMGGSITDGSIGGTETVCWRNQITGWFKDNFPEAQINPIKASMGGTDTYLASFRMDSVLLDVGTPDLVFIEYATNDYHEGNNFRSSARQLESIILKLRNANPNVDIVVIFSFKNFRTGVNMTQSVKGMKSIADYYGIKALPIGFDAYDEYKDSWYLLDDDGNPTETSFTSDDIHLTELGHNYYTNYLTKIIGKEILARVPGKVLNTEFKAQEMPKKFHNNTLENSYMVTEMEEYLTENTTFIKNTGEFSWVTERFPNSYIGTYNNSGDVFEFKFTGTECGIVYAMVGDNAYIRYRVDGGIWYYPTLKLTGGNGNNPKVYRLFQGLENGEHTVTIEVLGTKPQDSTGYNFRIGALLINPDDSAYSDELASPSLLRPDGIYQDVTGLADNDKTKTEWDAYGIYTE